MTKCGFQGNLDDIWKHYADKHEIIQGRIKTQRVDGTEFINDQWVEAKGSKPIVNEKGEYVFECLEELED